MRLKPHQFRFWRGSRRGSAKGQATASRPVAPAWDVELGWNARKKAVFWGTWDVGMLGSSTKSIG